MQIDTKRLTVLRRQYGHVENSAASMCGDTGSWPDQRETPGTT